MISLALCQHQTLRDCHFLLSILCSKMGYHVYYHWLSLWRLTLASNRVPYHNGPAALSSMLVFYIEYKRLLSI